MAFGTRIGGVRPLEKRNQRRTRKRLTCELVIGESRQTVLVRDLSPEGLFVQTRAKVDPNGHSSVFTVRAESMQAARARALSRAGRLWKIADIQEI